jgi:GTP pyrophosphokinase
MLGEVDILARLVDPVAEISGRVKDCESAERKGVRLGIHPSLVLDNVALRVIVRQASDCYELQALIQSRFIHLATENDDYISRPKANGYRSLHTIVLTDSGFPVEVQLRTPLMHACAETGSASHQSYKWSQRNFSD